MTCQVAVESDSGRVQYGRAILDSGSTLTLVTSRFAKCLRAKMNPSFISINAVGQTTPQHSKSTVSLTLRSIHNDTVSVNCQAAVVDRITCDIPGKKIVDIRSTPFLKDLELADPEFDCPGRIDLLLGGTLCQQIILGEKRCTDDKRLYARDTIFGWAITGEWDVSSRNAMVNVCLRSSAIDQQTHQLVESFWKIEDVPFPNLHLSLEDSQAVDHFKDTHLRDNDGRYIVRLPRHQPPLELGCSRDQAVRRFQQNYKSLDKKEKWEQFRDAVDEYATLQHAEEVPAASLTKAEAECFYMPMHSVTKETSTTTKLRVVFDASAKTTSGNSLNNILLRGPTQYPLISTVLIKFRQHLICMSSDISKMFREIGLHEDDRDLHRFVRRIPQTGLLKDWRMTRVTFGVVCSPFLATQVLRQVASDYRQQFSDAASIIETTFYVDDCLTGADTVEEAVHIREEFNVLLAKACMNLRKWRSNSTDLLQTIPDIIKEKEDVHMFSVPTDCHKALGIHWHTTKDTLHVATPIIEKRVYPTKRQISSDVAKTFDILGWFAPAIVIAKVLLQRLWQLNVGWDEKVPLDIATDWEKWRQQIHLLTGHPVPWCYYSVGKSRISIQLHGFADASQKAYAAVVYLRVLYSDTSISIALVTAKTKVAPISPQTIPRLELCAAVLLSKLLRSVMFDLQITMENVYA